MSSPDLSRRDFTRLTAAAFGGLLAGTAVGCAQKEPAKPAAGTATPAVKPPGEVVAAAKVEAHACRGLNSCKSDKNECAGQSTCATGSWAPGENACKNLGGCGSDPGANECKGHGGCEVPMKPEHGAWEKARKSFEERMTKAGKKFGAAPEMAEAKKDEKPGS